MQEWVEVLLPIPVNQSFTYKKPQDLSNEKIVGKRVSVQFGTRKIIGFAVREFEKLPDDFPLDESKIKPIIKLVDKEVLFTKNQIELAYWISSFYLCSKGEALSAMLPSGKRESKMNSIDFDDYVISKSNLDLSLEQTTAINGILNSKENKPFYVFGATGTGKTEVFLQIAKTIISQDKTVVYLVPEITLTHQVIDAVCTRFGKAVAVLHSKLTGSQRLAEWMRIKRKEAKIVVGARSAVFAPVQDLGLIIIDEEHDGSYKSGQTPRYHARQVAMKICKDNNAKLVLGSATPSLESWYQIEQKQIIKFTLTERLSGGDFPETKIIDLKNSDGPISKKLIEEITNAKKENRQSLLFLNRRGFSHFFKCFTCGYELICKNCSVSLTYHKKNNYVKCHYCGMQSKPPSVCPECNSLDVGYAGFGTEFIESQVKIKFPNLNIKRIDTDAFTKKGELKAVLDEFMQGKIDILLGTQMVAKGLNFPGLKVVGIVLADTGLHMPDFRAAERTFSLIVQVTGRAGRFFPDGKVLLQTYNPLHPSIQFAAQNDIEGFYDWELKQRKELDFPPFTRLVRLVFRSKQINTVIDGANSASKILISLLKDKAEVLGPAECPISMISGNHRWQILIKNKTLKPILNAISFFQNSYKPLASLYMEIDVDPLSLL